MLWGPRRDQGTAHVLEAVLVASIMLSAVAYVSTYDQPVPRGPSERALLAQKANDALAILHETPAPEGSMGANLLSALTMECLQGDCGNLTRKLDGILPASASYALYLSNGQALHPVHAPRAPPGEAVTARHLVEPGWSYQLLVPAMSSVNPTEDPVTMYGLPVFHAHPVSQGGNLLSVLVHGTRASDNSSYVLKGSMTTRAVANEPAASLYFADGAGNPLASRDVRAQTIDASTRPTGANVTFRLRVEETAGVALPAGTRVTVQLPHGWTGGASQAVNDASWTVLANATDVNGTARGSRIVAELRDALASSSQTLVFNASYRGDANDYYAFEAFLSRGGSARAETLVRADAHATPPPYEVPSVLLSAPRPLGAGGSGTWTLAAFVPHTLVNVTRIEITEETGASIFGSVQTLSGAGGSWSSEGDRLVWSGSAALTRSSPLNLTFRVGASSSAASAADVAPFTPSVRINGWDAPLTGQPAPGLYRGVFLPADGTYKGYNTSTGLGLTKTHPVDSTSVLRSTDLPGSGNYTVAQTVGMRSKALFGSNVRVEDRHVAYGEDATMQVDVQSVMYNLATLGVEPVVTIKVFPPWTTTLADPLYTQTLHDPGLTGPLLALIDPEGDGMPRATSVGQYAVGVPVQPEWLYGTYLVQVEVSWDETLTGTVGGVVVSELLSRKARVFDYFVVQPVGERLAATPVYDVHLVVWMDDWR